MTLSPSQIAKLKKIVSLAQELLKGAEGTQSARRAATRTTSDAPRRRSGKELESFRKMLKAERKKGASVADLARKHGISPAYIYQLR